MNHGDEILIYKQLSWDYNISPVDIKSVLKGDKASAGHFTQEMLFIRMLETYPWFTILQVLNVYDIKKLLTTRVVSKLRSASLREKYEFVRLRLQQVIPSAG
ncbi:MAG: hypothetical protein GT600_17325 [Bacteroidales bacterium]|jgi:hypothetical protein|nr:hypothetical protein [Bacteroidales bacterium]